MKNAPGQKRSMWEFYPCRYDILFLLCASFSSLLAGLSLPLITVEKTVFWRHWQNDYSVFTGIVNLAKDGDILLAFVLFFFSMVFPFLKLFALVMIWLRKLTDQQRAVTLHWLEMLGKWSMLDVFAVAILIVAAKLRALTQVEPRIGVYFFGAAILLAMITTMIIDHLARKISAS